MAGWNWADGEFKLIVQRSMALVNKSSEFLKDDCLVNDLKKSRLELFIN